MNGGTAWWYSRLPQPGAVSLARNRRTPRGHMRSPGFLTRYWCPRTSWKGEFIGNRGIRGLKNMAFRHNFRHNWGPPKDRILRFQDLVDAFPSMFRDCYFNIGQNYIVILLAQNCWFPRLNFEPYPFLSIHWLITHLTRNTAFIWPWCFCDQRGVMDDVWCGRANRILVDVISKAKTPYSGA